MRPRSAFTLIEVMVALVVSGIVLLGARAMLEVSADEAHHIVLAATDADREANAERVLRAVAGRLEVGIGAGSNFAGQPAMATFTSWCDVPRGWQERCRVLLSIERDGAANSLVLSTSAGDTICIRSGIRHGTIAYLSSPEAGGSWISVWGTGITAPVALGLFLDRDTVIVRIGERG